MMEFKKRHMYCFGDIVYNINVKAKPSEFAQAPYIGLEHLNSDTLEIDRWGMGEDVSGDKLKINKGDILFGKRRAYQRKVGIAPFDGIFSAHGFVFRANRDVIDENLLPIFYSIGSVYESCNRNISRITFSYD